MGISYFRSVWNAACFRQHFWKDCSWRREYFKTHAHAHRAHAHQLLVLTGVQQNKKIESINRQRARPVNLKVPTSHDSVMAKKDHAPHCQYFWFAEFTSTRCTQHTGKSSFKKQNKKNTTSYQIALHSVAQGKKKNNYFKALDQPKRFPVPPFKTPLKLPSGFTHAEMEVLRFPDKTARPNGEFCSNIRNATAAMQAFQLNLHVTPGS